MKWLEKHWVVVAVVIVAYLYLNGSLSNLLGGGQTVANVTVPTTTNDGNQWYGVL